ncbi:MAG: DUF839 domain-containing protein [Timaviella obliquedivisa GSE-PSE-MK23-08B]|jgi:hypothetical protein|nr:DUF839 domain-containing protein [Timaviella obliquedivisa GSE-PSE-MK23-08B]
MAVNRRHFLIFLGAGAGTLALHSCSRNPSVSLPFQAEVTGVQGIAELGFIPIKGTMPLKTDGLTLEKQLSDYGQFTVQDDLVLPEGFTYDIVASWGDRVGDSRFGYNNDYISFVETSPNQGYLTINHEYISAIPWLETFEQVVGKTLPVAEVKTAVEAAGKDGINASAMPNNDPMKAKILEICKEAMTDLGISVISVRQETDGKWTRTYSTNDRCINGISGLDNPSRLLKSTGPATAIFRKTQGLGYIDKLGDRIVGTFSNCAGGITPWGTSFSAEENFQSYVPEDVNSDGTSLNPSKRTFAIDAEEIAGIGNVFGMAGNKYGWMVEVDPTNPADYGTKHTWLGRFRHEAVAVNAVAGRKLAVYSGCDRRGGHVYKFVSTETVTDITNKLNSRLLESGMLYAAKFNGDGTGRWIALQADTPINPDLPSVHVGKMITLPNPDRAAGGSVRVENDAAIAAYKQQFKTLGDLYQGTPEEKQGAILIDAHYAANAAGATCTARPEDTDMSPNGGMFVAFTSGASSSSDGSPDTRVFKGPNGETSWEHGWVVRIDEIENDSAAMTFKWSLVATGGEPAEGGMGFSNPDNLAFDKKGNLWMVMDMSSAKINQPLPAGRIDKDGKPLEQSDLRAVYGNNSIWYMPMSGANAGKAYLFGFGPMDAEMTGPFLASDQKTLFMAAQHPGETNGMRKGMAAESRKVAMRTTDGKEFMQTREVPIGSNWPGKQANTPPKPSVVAIRRTDGGTVS